MKKVLIGAALLLAGTAAFAQTTPPPGVSQGTTPVTVVQPAPRAPQMHMRMMSDKVMTRDEVVGHVRRMFEHLDANRDGVVTRDEVDSMHRRMSGMHEGRAKKMAERGMRQHDRGAAFDSRRGSKLRRAGKNLRCTAVVRARDREVRLMPRFFADRSLRVSDPALARAGPHNV